MDRNTFTGLFLIMLIIAGSVYFMKPTNVELQKERDKQHIDSLKKAGLPVPNPAAADTSIAAKPVDSAALKSAFGATLIGSENLITVENKDIRLKLTTRGGRIYSVELKNFKTFDKKPLILFDGDKNKFGFSFAAGNASINTNERYFTPSATSLNVVGQDSASITMRLSYSPTQYIDYIYSLKGEGYKVGLTIKPVGLDNVIVNSGSINLDWESNLRRLEKSETLDKRYSYIGYFNTENSYDFFGDTKDDQKEIADKKIQWVTFKQHFFSSVLLAKEGFTKSNLTVVTDTADHADIKETKASLQLAKSADGT
ncbi:MAG: membrane protein insertase YidC, partial [Mucilaginibacter sp.]